jgi:hypothetical protein
MEEIKDIKPLESSLTQITPAAAMHVAVMITLDRICKRVNLLASKVAELEAAAVTTKVKKKVEVENA